MPLFFWFNQFLDSKAEILEIISLVFLSKRWHQKDILKLTDLYLLSKIYGPVYHENKEFQDPSHYAFSSNLHWIILLFIYTAILLIM